MLRTSITYPYQQGLPVKQFVLELILALSNRYQLFGKMDLIGKGEDKTLAYQSADQAIALLSQCNEVFLVSIQDRQFNVLLEKTQAGLELDYLSVDPQEAEVYAEVRELSTTILAHLSAMHRLASAAEPEPSK